MEGGGGNEIKLSIELGRCDQMAPHVREAEAEAEARAFLDRSIRQSIDPWAGSEWMYRKPAHLTPD